MVSCKNVFLTLTLVVIASNQCECGVYSLIRDLLQWNVAGIPIIHKTVKWDFDPEVSQKRREQFFELHGYRAGKYLERIGLGIDGKQRERAYQHAIRDQGKLQGLSILQP
ncbi:CLUMA_CG016161, isoform A [Clunio marinus]|uniref:CLUMA_CG016161, isoform A n=1 Tax=Clunio marinus TaxID=568069 RepID=A0A1J1ITC1_9DIPT|nr:CLUMA_CG016161, isoform A [Clunio marinus]